MPIREVLSCLVAGERLSPALADSFFDDLFAGRLDHAQIAAALALMQTRGVTCDELVAGALAMRAHVTPIPDTDSLSGVVLDTCGTGGAPKTFNISTLAAIVTAAAAPPDSPHPVRVAKHGNRSRTGRGSAELLASLGVNIDAPPALQSRCLREVGVCFCFAVNHHPAAKHAAPARASLGFPTIFNLLGPLTNPARATHQLLGIYSPALVPLMGEALARLGSSRAWVVHGEGQMDEISTLGLTNVASVADANVTHRTIDPAQLGLATPTRDSLLAEDLEHAVRIARDVLAASPGPCHDIVCLNAAGALVVAGAASDLAQGYTMAHEAVSSGAATRVLTLLARLSHETPQI